ncbi:MAG: ABC transporter permease [Armatimonadota bacterium]|nr:ABC transporter permease [Armatimonadota bacterium]
MRKEPAVIAVSGGLAAPADGPARRGLGAVLRGLAGVVPVATVLVLWDLVARSGLVNPRLFPTVGAIAEQAVLLAQSPQLGLHAGASLTRVVAGFGVAVVLGVPLGIAMSRLPRFGRAVEPLFSFGYPVPRIALYPIFIFLFGIGHLSKVVLIVLECLYPIAVHTYYGVRSVDRLYIWSAQNMGATRGQIIWKVMAPAAAPHVFAGLRIALPIAFIITILTEMVSSTEGLGWLILYSSASLLQARVFASVAIVAVIGFVMDRVLAALRNRLIFWEREVTLVAIR